MSAEPAALETPAASPWTPPGAREIAAGRRSDLLDVAAAHTMLGSIGRAVGADAYVYQQPLSGRSGRRASIGGRSLLMLSSYDYLGLIGDPRIEGAAIDAIRRYGTGTGGVRLLTGTTELHHGLERELAQYKGTEAALTFSSGYMANLAAIAALFGPRDEVVADERAHRSLLDACRVAGVPVRRFRHDDASDLERILAATHRPRRRLVVVEGVYSMDGDLCSLPPILECTHRHRAFLMVDESHSLGTVGPSGRGIDEHHGVPASAVDIWSGALSKAIPSAGGFLAGSRELVLYLQHAAAPFIFSSAAPPPAVAAARQALRIAAREPERRARLWHNADRLRAGLRRLGYDTGASQTGIIPLIVGEDGAAYALSRGLFACGILATPVVHPAVAQGAARLRLCVTAAHTDADLDEALEAFRTLAHLGARAR